MIYYHLILSLKSTPPQPPEPPIVFTTIKVRQLRTYFSANQAFQKLGPLLRRAGKVVSGLLRRIPGVRAASVPVM